jgi:glucose 1-dehydrogenase/3-oxoacyl-[acyl-carrier protein] reductase
MGNEPLVVLVTGAGKGIGAGIAEHLERRGWRVAAHYFGEAPAHAPAWLAADLSVAGEAAALVTRVVEQMGRLDAVVHNAGVDLGPMDSLDMTRAQYDLILNVNLAAAFELAQALAGHLRERGGPGRFISISSVHAKITLAGRAAYAASKGGLEALTRSLALEFAPHRITVNAIAPGFIEVQRSREAIPGYDAAAIGRAIPAGRVGQPSDIGAAAAYLLSEEASFVTGQVLTVDGGSSIKLDFQV